jgi:radical SAM protein with 4Fe4S-binding SPASM domain
MVSTNGQPFASGRVIDALLEHPPDYLICAIDGLTEQTNAVFRIGARLQTILDGVHALADGKRTRGQPLPILHMRYIVMKHNQHEVSELRSFAAEHGFDLLTVRTLSSIPVGEQSPHLAMVPDDPRYRAYEHAPDGRKVRRDDYLCQHAFGNPLVLADGRLVPCDQHYDGQHAYGQLDEQTSFAELWFGRAAARFRRVVRDDRHSLTLCHDCCFADRPANESSIEMHTFGEAVRSAW